MKIRRMSLGIFLALLFTLLSTAAFAQSSEGVVGSANEPLFGTWMNKEYTNTVHDWRIIYQSDGKAFYWFNGKPADQPSSGEGRIVIDKKWQDSEGNIWYRVAEKVCIGPYSDTKAQRYYGLVKMHPAADALEGEWSTVDFPEEFGALGGKHYTYYRES